MKPQAAIVPNRVGAPLASVVEESRRLQSRSVAEPYPLPMVGDGDEIARVGVVHECDLLRRGITSCLSEDPLTVVAFSVKGGTPAEAADVVVASPRGLQSGGYTCPVVLCVADAGAFPASRSVVAVIPWSTLTAHQLTASVRAAAAGFRLQLELVEPLATAGFDQRGIDVLRMLASGETTRSISQRLSYSERTIKAVIQDLERGLNAATRAQAVAEALRRGLI